MTLSALALIAAAIMIFGVGNRIPGDDQSGAETDGETTPYDKTGPPPAWVMALMLLVIAVTMLVLAWYWPE
jgi:hypothetical protein